MTSAEPGRRTLYSLDLRCYLGMELSYRRTAANLNVALGTVYNINRLFKKTGDVLPNKIPRRNELRLLRHSDELFII